METAAALSPALSMGLVRMVLIETHVAGRSHLRGSLEFGAIASAQLPRLDVLQISHP